MLVCSCLALTFYEKELSFQVSCSYGPGRYDENYELAGHDYPFGLVRWTEQRNFEAVLDLMRDGKINVADMISTRIPQVEAAEAYTLLTQDKSVLGIVLTYPDENVSRARTVKLRDFSSTAVGKAVVGIIGSGNFASRTLLPALTKTPRHSNQSSVQRA